MNKIPRLSRALGFAQSREFSQGIDSSSNEHMRIVHLGIGAFHRAHQAVYTEKANQKEEAQWRISGVSLRSAKVAGLLNPQDGLYTVISQDGDSTKREIIQCIDEVLVAPESPHKVLVRMASASTHIISLTITEKGYCRAGSGHTLATNSADIQHDLAHIDAPRTALGFIISAILLRHAKGIAPFTLVSCDNLPDNGLLLRALVLRFAQALNQAHDGAYDNLVEHIKSHYRFVCTMVDRIVPAMNENVLAEQNAMLIHEGVRYHDKALIVTEPFSQWIIENNFAGPRPSWEKAGAILTKDVQAFESMKLRLLNGAHSSIAYLGYLAGKTFVNEVMANPKLAAFINYIIQNELLPSVIPPEGIALDEYCKSLIIRFNNPNLKHRCYQIAMDGSQKLPQRLLEPLQHALSKGNEIEGMCAVLAAWMVYVSGTDLQGQQIKVQDPLAEQLAAVHKRTPLPQANELTQEDELQGAQNQKISLFVEQMLAQDAIFDASLAKDARFVSRLNHSLCKLIETGDIEAFITHVLERQDIK